MSTKTSPETYVCKLRTQSWQDGAVVTDATQTEYRSYINERNTLPDVVPDYKRRIRRHESATSSLDGIKRRPTQANMVAYRKLRNRLSGVKTESMISGNLLAAATVPGVTPSHPQLLVADDLAKESFVRQALSRQQAVEGLVVLGELGQTIRQLRDPLRSLRNGFQDYIRFLQGRRGGYLQKSRKVRRKFLADSWLEWSFGISPLLSDIDGAAEALASDREIAPEAEECSGFGEARRIYSDGGSFRATTTFNLTWRELVTDVRQVRFYGKVRSYSGSALGYWPRRLGTVWTNFVPTLWEIVPWSFAIDYFSNAGKILQAYSFHECNLSWVARTVRTGQHMVLYDHKLSPVDSLTYQKENETLQPGRSEWDFTTVNRAPYTGTFVPAWRFKMPGTDTKWLNLAALARSKFDFMGKA